MKKLILVISITLSIITSCSKSSNQVIGPPLYGFQNSAWINVDSFKNILVDSVTYKMSFDSLISDSRCPTGANCPWAGYVLTRLKCTIGSTIHTIKLSIPKANNTSQDTTINGVTILLDSVLPHPAINNTYPYIAYKAKVKISH